MIEVNLGDRDVQLRAVIKSNLVCGDLTKIDELADNILGDICDLLENFQTRIHREEE